MLEDEYKLIFTIYYAWDGYSDDNIYYFNSIDKCKSFFNECLNEINIFDKKYHINDLHCNGEIYFKEKIILEYEYYLDKIWKDANL